jgi:hypothetical protein
MNNKAIKKINCIYFHRINWHRLVVYKHKFNREFHRKNGMKIRIDSNFVYMYFKNNRLNFVYFL